MCVEQTNAVARRRHGDEIDGIDGEHPDVHEEQYICIYTYMYNIQRGAWPWGTMGKLLSPWGGPPEALVLATCS